MSEAPSPNSKAVPGTKSRFCVQCGTALLLRPSRSSAAVRQTCPACQVTVYDTPSVVVATLPVTEQRVILIRRATEPGHGKWAYAGGYLEAGETLEAAAIRETREETGLEVRIAGLLGVYSRPGGRSITIVFLAAAERDDWAPGPEALEVKAFEPGQIPWDGLAFWTVTYALEDWLHVCERELSLPSAWRVGPPRL